MRSLNDPCDVAVVLAARPLSRYRRRRRARGGDLGTWPRASKARGRGPGVSQRTIQGALANMTVRSGDHRPRPRPRRVQTEL